MKIVPHILFLSLFVILFSCKNNAENDSVAGQEAVIESDNGFMKDRPSGEQDHSWTFLTNQLFHYTAGFTVGEKDDGKLFVGHWIDLDSDGTFEKGIYKKTTYTGQWTYDHNVQELTLYPDPDEEKNTQWKVMSNDDMVVLVGTAKYGDNATQIRLVRHKEKPSK